MELATLAKYPFLREAGALIRSEKVSLEEILLEPAYARARALGKARVLEALEKVAPSDRIAIAPADQLAQLLAYPVARIFVSALEDTYLIRRFALREAIAAEGRAEHESDDLLLHMAAEIGMDLRREDGGFRLHFTDFLRFTNTMRDAPWKLINQQVVRGYVLLRRDKAVRVMRNAIQRHIEQGLPLPVSDDILNVFRADLREIRGILEAEKPRHVDRPRCTAVAWPRTANATRNHSSGWNATGATPQSTRPLGDTMSWRRPPMNRSTRRSARPRMPAYRRP